MCSTLQMGVSVWTKAEALKWEGLTSTVLIEALIISKQPTIAENTRKTSQYCFPRAGKTDVFVEITRSMLDQHTGRGGEGRGEQPTVRIFYVSRPLASVTGPTWRTEAWIVVKKIVTKNSMNSWTVSTI